MHRITGVIIGSGIWGGGGGGWGGADGPWVFNSIKSALIHPTAP